VASNTLIDKLQAPTKVHPTPYSVQWLGPKDEVITLRQALISFSIASYCSEVLCDFLLMDACHLLLGKPWLFDNHVIYDRYANTYSLIHTACKLTLAPLPPPKPFILNKGREERKVCIRVKHKMRVPLKSKPKLPLLMVKPNTSEVVNPFHPISLITPQANGVEFMYGITLEKHFPSKLSLGV